MIAKSKKCPKQNFPPFRGLGWWCKNNIKWNMNLCFILESVRFLKLYLHWPLGGISCPKPDHCLFYFVLYRTGKKQPRPGSEHDPILTSLQGFFLQNLDMIEQTDSLVTDFSHLSLMNILISLVISEDIPEDSWRHLTVSLLGLWFFKSSGQSLCSTWNTVCLIAQWHCGSLFSLWDLGL